MRILIVHNQLWAHYKSKLFEEIHKNLSEAHPEAILNVIQIGLYESARSSMQTSDDNLYDYPYEVLFRKSLDQISFGQRVTALFKAYSAFRPTVVNITGYYDWAQILLMCYARLQGVKVVLSSESSILDHKRSNLKERVKRWIVNRANSYFCFGKTSVDYLLHLGVKEDKIAVRNAAVIDDKRVKETYLSSKKPSNSPNFIFVGRFSEEKNLLLLLDAYFEARAKHPAPWGLILVGDGPARPEVENYLSKKQPSGVVLTGGVSWLEVPEWLARADALVLPSKSEPWGLVVNEALVCGLPVLVSENCGCAPDLVEPGKNGYLFNPERVDELAQHMLHLMNSTTTERESYSFHGQSIVSKFAADKVAGEMVKTFAQLNGVS